MHIVPGFILREIAGDIIVIPTGEAARRLSGVITLNECGKFLFELLSTEQTEETLVSALLAEYDVDYETAVLDVKNFLDRLSENGFLA